MTIRAVIFDLDGVLIESEPHLLRAELAVFRARGIPLTEEIAAAYLGYPLHTYVDALSRQFATRLDHAAVAAALRREVERVYAQTVPLVAGVTTVLTALRRSYKVALATSRERRLATIVLRRLGITSFFEHSGYGDEVPRGKPNPDIFLTAARLLGGEPQACAVVEDAAAGFEAGKHLGMRVIARKATHNRHQNFSGVDALLPDDVSVLPELLAALVRRAGTGEAEQEGACVGVQLPNVPKDAMRVDGKLEVGSPRLLAIRHMSRGHTMELGAPALVRHVSGSAGPGADTGRLQPCRSS